MNLFLPPIHVGNMCLEHVKHNPQCLPKTSQTFVQTLTSWLRPVENMVSKISMVPLCFYDQLLIRVTIRQTDGQHKRDTAYMYCYRRHAVRFYT